MAVEAERLIVSVSAQGADSADREIRSIGDSAVESATEVETLGGALDSVGQDAIQLSGSLQALQGRLSEVDDEFDATDRSASGASRSLSGFASAALAAVGPITTLNGRLDETDDELDNVRNSAIGASGAMGSFASSSLAATAASYTMHDALMAGAIPALVVFASTLGPLVGIVGALSAGLLGLAGGFGAVLGSGALAWFQQTENAMGRLKAVQEELIAIAADFGQQFIPLIDSAIAAVPELARRLVAATGDMTPFVNELQRLGSAAMDVLPQILGWFMDIGREALPVWRDFTNWVGQKTPAALEFFRSVVSRTWDSVHELSLALLDAAGTFTEFGVVAVNTVAPMLETLLGAFQGLLEWVLDLPPALRDLTVAGAALAPVFTMGAVAGAELLRILRSLSVTFTTSNTALARLTPAFGTMAIALGAVATAAIALGDVYEENFAGIRTATHRVSSVLKDEFLQTFRVARNVIGTILREITSAFTTFVLSSESDIASLVDTVSNGLVSGIRSAGAGIRAILFRLETAWTQHGDRVLASAGNAYRQVVSVIRTVLQTLTTVVSTALNSLRSWWTRHGTQVRTVVSQAYNAIRNTIRAVLGGILQIWNQTDQQILSTVRTTTTTLRTIIGGALNGILSIVRSGHAQVRMFWRQHGSQVASILRNSWNLLVGITTTILGVLSSTVQSILNGIGFFWTQSGQHWVRTIRNATTSIIRAFRNLAGIIVQIVEPLLARLTAFWQQHGRDIRLIVNTLVKGITALFTGLVTALSEITRRLFQVLKVTFDVGTATIMGIWNLWGDELVAVLEFAVDIIISVLGAFIDTIASLIRAGTAAINGDWSTAWNEIAGLTRRIANGIIGFISSWVSRFVGYIGDLVGKVIGWFQDLYQRLIGNSIIPDMLSDIITAVRNWDLVGEISSVIEDVISEITGMGGRFKEAGKGLLDSFITGIQNKKDEALGAIENFADDASSLLTGSDAEEGPLDNVTGQGEGLPKAFASGIEDRTRVVQKATESMAEKAKPTVAAEGLGPVRAEGSGKTIYHIKVDARGADNPTDVKRNAERGLTSALKSQNVGR